MKTALLHYWLINMRGGENVFAEFCNLYPDADIFTHAWNPRTVTVPFHTHRITETFIGKLPLARTNCQKYLPLMPLALSHLNLSEYDLLLSSESGPVKGIRKRPDAKHVCYCHTPMRYLWDMYDDYYRNTGLAGKTAMTLFKRYLRNYDLRSVESVDHFIANSAFVAERIKRIYNRDSTVIHPPVNTDFYKSIQKTEEPSYYFFIGQLISYKRADLAIQACVRMNRRLLIAGDGPVRKQFEGRVPDNIRFVGRPDNEELRRLYAGAKALIFPGIEDFGIVPLEAQAAGTPVIARGVGGARETVVAGKTGVFFNDADVDSLCGALEEFESMQFDSEAARINAARFNIEVFRQKITDFLKNI